MSMCYLLGKTIYLSFFCRCTFKTIFMDLIIWWRRSREWFWNNENWVLCSCCYLFSHSIIRMLPENRTSGNNWWKKGIARQSARRIALWLVFILLCKHGGSGKSLSQASGKTGEFWEKMRRLLGEELWEVIGGEFKGNCFVKGWYNPLHLPKKTSLKSTLFISSFWRSTLFSGYLQVDTEREQGWTKE